MGIVTAVMGYRLGSEPGAIAWSQSAWAAIGGTQIGWLEQQMFISHSSGGRSVRLWCSQGWFLLRPLSLGCRWLSFWCLINKACLLDSEETCISAVRLKRSFLSHDFGSLKENISSLC